jgi:cytochrome c biogenesis protein CcmG/thiol:disulfide interchange protein DsbE
VSRGILPLVAGAALLLGGCGDDEAATLPAVELPALAAGGAPLELGSLTGPAIVNLWATWCVPCRTELPEFQAASEDHVGVRFVGVDIGEDPAVARSFLDDLGVSFEQYADPGGELSDALGVAALPVTLVVDGDGDIAERHLGPMTRDDLDDAIADI